MDHEEDVSFPSGEVDYSASQRLRRLHDSLNKLIEDKEALQKRLSEEFGPPSNCPTNSRRKIFEFAMDTRTESYCPCQCQGCENFVRSRRSEAHFRKQIN